MAKAKSKVEEAEIETEEVKETKKGGKELSDVQNWNLIAKLFGAENVMHPEQTSHVDIIRTGSPSFIYLLPRPLLGDCPNY